MAIGATHKKMVKKRREREREREIVDRRTVQIYEAKIMVEILRFEYDGTSFEDYEDLKDMKRFLLLRFLGNQTEGRWVRTQNLHFTIQKAVKWNFQKESFSFSLKKIQGKSDQNQQQQKKKLEFSSEKLTQMRTDYRRKSWNWTHYLKVSPNHYLRNPVSDTLHKTKHQLKKFVFGYRGSIFKSDLPVKAAKEFNS